MSALPHTLQQLLEKSRDGPGYHLLETVANPVEHPLVRGALVMDFEPLGLPNPVVMQNSRDNCLEVRTYRREDGLGYNVSLSLFWRRPNGLLDGDFTFGTLWTA